MRKALSLLAVAILVLAGCAVNVTVFWAPKTAIINDSKESDILLRGSDLDGSPVGVEPSADAKAKLKGTLKE